MIFARSVRKTDSRLVNHALLTNQFICAQKSLIHTDAFNPRTRSENVKKTQARATADPTGDGTKFYARVRQNLNRAQMVPSTTIKRVSEDYSTARENARWKNHYDQNELTNKLNTAIQKLSLISPNSDLLSIPDDDNDIRKNPFLSINLQPSPSQFKGTLKTFDLLPKAPKEFRSNEEFHEFLQKLTNYQYTTIEMQDKHLVGYILQDLLRPSNPNTQYYLTTESFNLGIKYFMSTRNFLMARQLFQLMKSSGNYRPNTKSYNLLLSVLPSMIKGGPKHYNRFFFNIHDKLLHLKKDSNWDQSKFSPNKPLTKSDNVYLVNPVDFMIKLIGDMQNESVTADIDTWNIAFSMAIGLESKRNVIRYMKKLKIPVNDMGLKSLISDLCDFKGTTTVMRMYRKNNNFPMNVEAVKTILTHRIACPSDTNINSAWAFLVFASTKITITTSILNVFAQRFARAGRIDLIIGITGAAKKLWNVNPNINTYTCMLEACARVAPHKNKAFLLNQIYQLALREWAKSPLSHASSLKPSMFNMPYKFRYWVRRSQAQFRFMREMIDKEANGIAKVSDPFSLVWTPGIEQSKLWEKSFEILEWKPNMPLKLSYNTKSKSTGFSRVLKDLGICCAFDDIYVQVKNFEKHPHDVPSVYSKEWAEFYNKEKILFRNEIDQIEREKRKLWHDNEYEMYKSLAKDQLGYI